MLIGADRSAANLRDVGSLTRPIRFEGEALPAVAAPVRRRFMQRMAMTVKLARVFERRSFATMAGERRAA
jgi:hypothetical protein